MTRIWSVVCCGALTAGVWSADPPQPSDKTKQIIGGAKVVDIILAIDTVEAFRVGSIDPEKAKTGETVAGRVIQGQGKQLPKEFAPKLITALLADETYFNGDSKGTSKDSGRAFRAKTRDGAVVEVSFCLMKGNVYLCVKDAAGKVIKYGDCRGFRNEPKALIRALAAEAFP